MSIRREREGGGEGEGGKGERGRELGGELERGI